MTIAHHLSEEFLLDYAAGNTDEGVSLLIATHLALCPSCRKAVRDMERIGGEIVESEPVVSDAAIGDFEALMARIDTGDRIETTPRALSTTHGSGPVTIPEPLRGYLGGDLDDLRWRTVGIGLQEIRVAPTTAHGRTVLYKVMPGVRMPAHKHEGTEFTLVLQGGFSDVTGHYLRGDVAVADEDIDHRPLADADEPCVCLVVTDAPLRLTGPIGRLLNPFLRV